MSFVEVRFPEDIAYGASGGPKYSTSITINEGGFEKRNANWQQSRAIYNVAHGIKTATQLDILIAFFRARKGRAYGFRFKDWSDFIAINQNIGIGDGVTQNFQLIKKYISGTVTEIRNINKPVAGTEKIYLNSILQTSGISINNTTGIVNFTTAPANSIIISADFEFDVPVRFDNDQLASTIDANNVHSWTNIELIEVRT